MSLNVSLGTLTAGDLGKTISVEDGGSTHTGELRTAKHSRSLESDITLITLRAGDWRHTRSYPSETPCVITEPAVEEAGR